LTSPLELVNKKCRNSPLNIDVEHEVEAEMYGIQESIQVMQNFVTLLVPKICSALVYANAVKWLDRKTNCVKYLDG